MNGGLYEQERIECASALPGSKVILTVRVVKSLRNCELLVGVGLWRGNHQCLPTHFGGELRIASTKNCSTKLEVNC